MKQLLIVLTILLVTTGCSRHIERALIHPNSAVDPPTFCFYRENVHTKMPKRHHRSTPIAIERIEVWCKLYDDRFEWGSEQDKKSYKLPAKEAWIAQYLPDPLLAPTEPFDLLPCIVYGKLPPGYREKAPAIPLTPEKLYLVNLRAKNQEYMDSLRFIIRLGPNGEPVRLEYIDDASRYDDIVTVSASGDYIRGNDKRQDKVQTILRQ